MNIEKMFKTRDIIKLKTFISNCKSDRLICPTTFNFKLKMQNLFIHLVEYFSLMHQILHNFCLQVGTLNHILDAANRIRNRPLILNIYEIYMYFYRK